MPMMVDLSSWFEDWLPFMLGSISDSIPDGVLWADINNVLVVDLDSTYLQGE